MKNTLITIIKFLSKNEYYFCLNSGELHQEIDECGCADHLLQNVYDRIYVSVCDLLDGYRIDPKAELTDDALEFLTTLTQEKADENHYYFEKMTQNEALQVIQEHPDLANLLLNTYQE